MWGFLSIQNIIEHRKKNRKQLTHISSFPKFKYANMRDAPDIFCPTGKKSSIYLHF